MTKLRDLIDEVKKDILGIDFETPHLAHEKHANFLRLCQEMELLIDWLDKYPGKSE